MLENFPPSNYQNKGKIWDIASAPNGIVYMAADLGLIEYDGKTWNTFKGSTGFTRSLKVINDSIIYTGSDLDFGIWRKNQFLAFEYTSLYPFQQDLAELNEEFWKVYQVEDHILFVSSQNIYIYRNDQLTKIAAPGKFSGSFAVNDSLYFADETLGLLILRNLALRQVFPFPAGQHLTISGIYHHGNDKIIVTRDSGLFRYSNGNLSPENNLFSETLKTATVFSFEHIENNYLAFGTVLRGLFVADLNGNVIHQINKNKGLQNNTILSLHYSHSGKLWLGMDYGISVIDLNNHFTYLVDYRGDFGTAQTALLRNGIFYLGTNQGLYQTPWENLNNDAEFSRFELVEGTEGQVWALTEFENSMFIGHDRGLFSYTQSGLQRIGNHQGVWTILPYKDYLLAGNYNGISVFEKSGNDWVFLKRMELILGSCNQLITENEDILWVNIPNFGLIRAVLDNDLFPVERVIFPEEDFEGSHPRLFKDEEGIHLLTSNHKYTYNASSNDFSRDTTEILFPGIEALLPGFYKPVALNQDYEFFPVYNGFALKYLHFAEELNAPHALPVLRKVEAFNNDEKALFFPGALIPSRFNNLRFEFVVPNRSDVLYQYLWSGKQEWSKWSPENNFDFYNLKHGNHTLLVRAKMNGEITEATEVSFNIATPWYHSWYASVFYIAVLILAILFFRKWQKVTLKKQKKKMLIRERHSLRKQALKYRQEIMQMEQERLKLESNKLKEQLKNKTVELANKAKENEDKNRLLLLLKDKCAKAQDKPAQSKMRWSEIQRLLDSYLSVEDKTFEIQMDELHQEFFQKLKDQFPALSVHDLRLCAYLKIGLNSKEIAEILNILPSSAFISRSRLRKKLNLNPEDDLHDFLNSI
ncbi:MAG: hypothetical protein K0B09_11155 [Bacteroidales bacterium]|nr:hypothetical protein [Bacteroidales bacterium]